MGKLIKFRSAGANDLDAAWMFGGLERVAVVFEDLDPIAVNLGLNRTELQSYVERQLTQRGIPLATLAELESSDDAAVVYVSVATEQHPSGPAAFMLSIQVCDVVTLARNPEQGGGVTTWLKNGVWITSPGELKRDVLAAVDEGVKLLGEAMSEATSPSRDLR